MFASPCLDACDLTQSKQAAEMLAFSAQASSNPAQVLVELQSVQSLQVQCTIRVQPLLPQLDSTAHSVDKGRTDAAFRHVQALLTDSAQLPNQLVQDDACIQLTSKSAVEAAREKAFCFWVSVCNLAPALILCLEGLKDLCIIRQR